MNWFERLRDLYQKSLIDVSRLENAIVKGLITTEQKLEIIET